MRRTFAISLLLLLCTAVLHAAQSTPAPPMPPDISIRHASSEIAVDGDLSDPAWQDASRVEEWFETNPGDNVTPAVRTVAYVAFDSKFLYVAFDLYDPDPSKVTAPYADRDQISGNSNDFAGIILDTRNDAKTGIELFVTPRGTQFDAVQDDTIGSEDASPDFFWDSAARINDHGWSLEMRIPFSSLRYEKKTPLVWGIQFYRNYPRERRYQIFSNPLPRGKNCFLCNERKLVGLNDLPPGGHLVAAPYLTSAIGQAREQITEVPPVSRMVRQALDKQIGADFKWTPNATSAVDGTVNPDFSQIESDVAAISTNERFAIFYPEKRPFFLEGVELFNTPMNAVYTRTINSPRWGIRSTGKSDGNAYTLLVSQDRGGGVTLIPGPNESDFAYTDFSTTNVIGRYRRDLGSSYASFILTDREGEGGSYNRVFGPDFQYRPTDADSIIGQFLVSQTQTPNQPDLADEWNGQKLSSYAGDIWWSHSTAKHDWYAEYKDVGKEFRADAGFIPQVGIRMSYGEYGYTIRPKGFASRIRLFGIANYTSQSDGTLVSREISPGFGGDGKYRSSWRIRYSLGKIRSGDPEDGGRTFDRNQLVYSVSFSPLKQLTDVSLAGWLGDNVDFANTRRGRGASVELGATWRPTDHLQLRFNNSARWLDVLDSQRLFLSQVQRVKATYTFNSRSFVRLISQYQRTDRDTVLYHDAEVSRHGGDLANSILFAYKVNWQSVVYFGYGDDSLVDHENSDLTTDTRQVFVKMSYAFQH